MAQGKSIAFFCEFVAKFNRLSKKFDKTWIERHRTLDTKIISLTIFKMVSGKHGASLTLNELWCKGFDFLPSLSQPLAVVASSFCVARKKMGSLFFKQLNSILIQMFDQYTDQRWLSHRVFCIDGSKINLPAAFNKLKFRKPTPVSHYPQALVSCLFNLMNKTSHEVLFTKSFNEINAAKKLLNSLKKRDVVVYDRAFLSYEMIALHIKSGLHAVFRTKEKNTLAIVTEFLGQTESDDQIYKIQCRNFRKIKVRLVRYYINGKVYCLLTTLLDQNRYSLKHLKELYHARWGVEEFFKLSKTYLHLENFHSQTKEGVEQEILAHFILLNLGQAVTNLISPQKQLNRRHSLNILVENIEQIFLSSLKVLRTKLLPWILGIISRCKIPKRDNRHYIRRSRKPINRWQKNITSEWYRKQRVKKATLGSS